MVRGETKHASQQARRLFFVSSGLKTTRLYPGGHGREASRNGREVTVSGVERLQTISVVPCSSRNCRRIRVFYAAAHFSRDIASIDRHEPCLFVGIRSRSGNSTCGLASCTGLASLSSDPEALWKSLGRRLRTADAALTGAERHVNTLGRLIRLLPTEECMIHIASRATLG